MGHTVALVNFPHAERRRSMPQTAPNLPPEIEIIELSRSGKSLFRNGRILAERAREFDILHLWKSYPDAAIPAISAAYSAGKPIHYDWDDWEIEITRELTGSNLAATLAGFMERRVLRLVDTLTVASEELRKWAVRWGFPEELIEDAPVGADLEVFHPGNRDSGRRLAETIWPGEEFPDPKRPVLAYVGQLEVAAYPGEAIRALAELRHPARLLMIGGGSKLEPLKALASELGAAGRVTFTDYIPADRVPEYLALADLTLAPFKDTAVVRAKSPLKIAESLASGVPVVASAVGEAVRMVEGCGVTVPCGDIRAFAAAIDSLLGDPNLLAEMGRAARRKAEEIYNWTITTGNLVRAYERALGQDPSTSRMPGSLSKKRGFPRSGE
jgi:glycosyltransferase involved in cell wall biosynthesis